jgi:hypothetical protein
MFEDISRETQDSEEAVGVDFWDETHLESVAKATNEGSTLRTVNRMSMRSEKI